MKNLVSNTLKAFSAWAVLGISCLCAQSGHILIANVPFDFSVVNQHFGAGAYTVSTDVSSSVILIRGNEDGSARFALTTAAQTTKVQEHAKLVFNRYGDHYFLTQVWNAGSDLGRKLQPSKAEQEMARNMGKPEVIALLASAPKPQR